VSNGRFLTHIIIYTYTNSPNLHRVFNSHAHFQITRDKEVKIVYRSRTRTSTNQQLFSLRQQLKQVSNNARRSPLSTESW